jgi:hypothetical protein
MGNRGSPTGRRHLLAAAAVAVVAVAASFQTAAAASSPTPPSCVVKITTFRFVPSTAPEGAATTLETSLRNCTGQARHVSAMQYGQEPPGCPVLDPISRPVDLQPHQRVSSTSDWTAPACAGRMTMYLRVNGSGGATLDQKRAVLRVTES